jgi:DNA-binding MarR family transcriptional regulator
VEVMAGTDKLDASIAYNLRSTYKLFLEFIRPKLEANDINIGMWYYLRVLWHQDGLTQTEITERVGVIAPTAGEQLRNMEKRGLIRRIRSGEDRRKVHVFLTPEGTRLKARLFPVVGQANALAVKGLSAAEIKEFRRILFLIRDNLNIP